MAKTLVDVDEANLAKAQQLLGTTTKKDTINAALTEGVAAAASRRDLARLADGQLADLADPETRARSWQR